MCPIADRDGMVVGVSSAAWDVTERQRADARFRGLLEAVPDAMVCGRADGRIALVNAQTERLFGYRRDELVGQPVERLVPEAMRDAHLGRRAGYEADPQPGPMGAGKQLAGRRRDASTFPADISQSTIDSDEGRDYAGRIGEASEDPGLIRTVVQDLLETPGNSPPAKTMPRSSSAQKRPGTGACSAAFHFTIKAEEIT